LLVIKTALELIAVTRSTSFVAAWESSLEPGALGGTKPELIANFNHFQHHSSATCLLSWATLRHEGELIGAAPVVRLNRCPAPMLLVPHWRQRLRWLNPLMRRNILLVDTSFLAYDAASPFLLAPGADRAAIKQQLCNFLVQQRNVHTVWIAEPAGEPGWARDGGWDQFQTMPISQISLEGIDSFEAYLAKLSQKRRRNYHKENQAFIAAGATIEILEGPLTQEDPKRLATLMDCLRASEARSKIYAPFNEVMINPDAFATQKQTILVASIDGKSVGFMAFVQAGACWMQVHGGLDYQQSSIAFAYHNLIYASIREAISRGCQLMTMGPLNNETKRRASTALVPIVVTTKHHWLADRLLAKAWFHARLGTYTGPL